MYVHMYAAVQHVYIEERGGKYLVLTVPVALCHLSVFVVHAFQTQTVTLHTNTYIYTSGIHTGTQEVIL